MRRLRRDAQSPTNLGPGTPTTAGLSDARFHLQIGHPSQVSEPSQVSQVHIRDAARLGGPRRLRAWRSRRRLRPGRAFPRRAAALHHVPRPFTAPRGPPSPTTISGNPDSVRVPLKTCSDLRRFTSQRQALTLSASPDSPDVLPGYVAYDKPCRAPGGRWSPDRPALRCGFDQGPPSGTPLRGGGCPVYAARNRRHAGARAGTERYPPGDRREP